MARGKNLKKQRKQKQAQQKSSSYEKDGFVFAFDDEQLQERYITQYKFYNTELGGFKQNLPQPSRISHAMATSLTKGNNKKDLDYILDIYRQKDMTWQAKGGKHKDHIFKEARKEVAGAKQMSQYIKAMYKAIEKLDKATGTEIKGETKVRYHMVYYAMTNGG